MDSSQLYYLIPECKGFFIYKRCPFGPPGVGLMTIWTQTQALKIHKLLRLETVIQIQHLWWGLGRSGIFLRDFHWSIYIYRNIYIGQHAIFLSVWIIVFTKVVATNYPDSPLAQIPEGRRCSFACGWPRGSSFAQQKIPHIQVEWNATKAHPKQETLRSL